MHTESDVVCTRRNDRDSIHKIKHSIPIFFLSFFPSGSTAWVLGGFGTRPTRLMPVVVSSGAVVEEVFLKLRYFT